MIEILGTISAVGISLFLLFFLIAFIVGGFMFVVEFRKDERIRKEVEQKNINRTIAQHEKDTFEAELHKPEDNQ